MPTRLTTAGISATVSPIRSGIERGFATMKRYYGYQRIRYIGLARNRCHLNLMCAAINLRRHSGQ